MSNSNNKILKGLAVATGIIGAAVLGKVIKKTVIDRTEELIEATKLPIITPIPGSIVICQLIGPLAEHSGIYIGDCKYGKNIIIDLHQTENGYYEIGAVTADEFLSKSIGNQKIYVSSDGQKAIGNEEIAQRALESIGNTGIYNLLGDNCHMFSAYCVSGEYHKYITSASLTNLINKHLRKMGHKNWRLWYAQPQECKYDVSETSH